MSLGNKLLNLRKAKQLSQEEVAEKLEVTRQTISKWETDQSTPDFDKIVPLCELYGITPDELLLDKKREKIDNKDLFNNKNEVINEDDFYKRGKRAQGISLGVLLYFVGIVWIMISVPVLMINPVVASAIFLLIWGFATYSIVYVSIMYKKKEKNCEDKKNNSVRKQISEIVAIFVTLIYLYISFTTMAWHITWIIWIVYAIFDEILKLIFMLRGENDEE